VAGGSLGHASQQEEAGTPRRVELEIEFIAAGTGAALLSAAPLGVAIRVAGFLAPRSRTARLLVLHIVEFELLGESDGH